MKTDPYTYTTPDLLINTDMGNFRELENQNNPDIEKAKIIERQLLDFLQMSDSFCSNENSLDTNLAIFTALSQKTCEIKNKKTETFLHNRAEACRQLTKKISSINKIFAAYNYLYKTPLLDKVNNLIQNVNQIKDLLSSQINDALNTKKPLNLNELTFELDKYFVNITQTIGQDFPFHLISQNEENRKTIEINPYKGEGVISIPQSDYCIKLSIPTYDEQIIQKMSEEAQKNITSIMNAQEAERMRQEQIEAANCAKILREARKRDEELRKKVQKELDQEAKFLEKERERVLKQEREILKREQERLEREEKMKEKMRIAALKKEQENLKTLKSSNQNKQTVLETEELVVPVMRHKDVSKLGKILNNENVAAVSLTTVDSYPVR